MAKGPSKTANGSLSLSKCPYQVQDARQHRHQSQSPSKPMLLCLPRELQDQIYNDVGDPSSFLLTCHELRASALDYLPGADMFEIIDNARVPIIDYAHAPDSQVRKQIEERLYVCKVNIIAEPWYSCESSLRYEVEWHLRENGVPVGRTRISRWTIRSPHSPMAKYISFYQPEDDVQVILEPATSGCLSGALMILRWKVFDICEAIQHIKTKPKKDVGRHEFSIHFRGGKDANGRLRKSFWETRPVHKYRRKRSLAGSRITHDQDQSTNDEDIKTLAYEYLMLPLIFNGHAWTASRLTFDIEPPNVRTPVMRYLFFEWAPIRPDVLESGFVGPQGLFDTTVRLYVDYQRQTGLGRYVPHASTGIPEQRRDDRDRPMLHPSPALLTWSMAALAAQLGVGREVAELLGGIPCQEARQLHSHLLRISGSREPTFAPCVLYVHHLFCDVFMLDKDMWWSYKRMTEISL